MPFYDYLCEESDCNHAFETQHGFYDRLTTCPECGKESLTRPFNVPVVSTPKTLGSLADRNASKMSSSQKTELARKYQEKKDTLSGKLKPGQKIKGKVSGDKPWFEQYRKKSDKQIKAMNQKEQKKYIEGK